MNHKRGEGTTWDRQSGNSHACQWLSQQPGRKFGQPSLILCCEPEQDLAITFLLGGSCRCQSGCTKYVTHEQESVLNPNPVKSWSIALWCRMVCGHSKTAVSFCLYLCIAASKGRQANWCVGFKCVGSVYQKRCAASTANFKLAHFEMVII
jgi:hypothetical protein